MSAKKWSRLGTKIQYQLLRFYYIHKNNQGRNSYTLHKFNSYTHNCTKKKKIYSQLTTDTHNLNKIIVNLRFH